MIKDDIDGFGQAQGKKKKKKQIKGRGGTENFSPSSLRADAGGATTRR